MLRFKTWTNIQSYHIRLGKKTRYSHTYSVGVYECVLLRRAMSCDNLSQHKVVIIDECPLDLQRFGNILILPSFAIDSNSVLQTTDD